MMLFTNGIEETRRWLEMLAMAQDEFRFLRSVDYGSIYCIRFYQPLYCR